MYINSMILHISAARRKEFRQQRGAFIGEHAAVASAEVVEGGILGDAVHADLAAIARIRRAARALGDWRLTGCALYVTLEPCPMCAGAISQARLERLVYGAADPKYGCAGSVYRIPEDPAFTHFCRSDGGVLAEECAALLDEFFASRR